MWYLISTCNLTVLIGLLFEIASTRQNVGRKAGLLGGLLPLQEGALT
jgi:hypothetical protein